MTRLLCTGDLHIRPGRLDDFEQVWDRIVDTALEHQVDALLFAGDAFEGPIPTAEEYLAFARPLRRLQGRIPVVAISGNGKHDSANQPRNALEIFHDGYAHALLDVHTKPALTDVAGVTVATLPWVPPGRLIAARNGGDRDDLNLALADALLGIARGLRGKAHEEHPDQPAVLMLHWSIAGAVTPTGRDVGPDFGPVLDLRALEEIGFDAVVAGHIHKPQVLSPGRLFEDGNGSHVASGQPIFYVGSPLPLNFGEEKCEHGVWLLDIDEAIRPHRVHADFLPIESRRFVTIDCDGVALSTAGPRVDLCLFDDEDEVAGAIVRVRYTATEEQQRRIDHQAIRQALVDAGAHTVRFAPPQIERENRARAEEIDETLSTADALRQWGIANAIADRDVHALQALTSGYLEELE